MIYNPLQIEHKVNEWKKTLDWIKPFYAIKSNPYGEIV